MNRREALGRNRKVASPLRTNGFLVLACALILGGAWYAWTWFSHPARVYGAKVLDCPPTQIHFETREKMTVIRGCGRSTDALCTEKECRPIESP